MTLLPLLEEEEEEEEPLLTLLLSSLLREEVESGPAFNRDERSGYACRLWRFEFSSFCNSACVSGGGGGKPICRPLEAEGPLLKHW